MPINVSPPSSKRHIYKAKGAQDLFRIRIIGMPPSRGFVPFAEWSRSSFVHGHADDGRFTFDDENGSMATARLVGFHDSFQNPHTKVYVNSWVVLPKAPFSVLAQTWTALSEMLGSRVFNSMEGNLRRLKPEEGNVLELLLDGYIPLIQNACKFPSGVYPHFQRPASTWVKSDLTAHFRPRSADGGIGIGLPAQKVAAQIEETDEPWHINQAFYAEVMLPDAVDIPECVQKELSFGLFAEEDFADGLRAPRQSLPAMTRARSLIANTMPLLYGHTSAACHALIVQQLMKDAGYQGMSFHGYWKQVLHWRDGDPTTLEIENAGYNKPKDKVDWLVNEAIKHFAARCCVGLGGSYRAQTTPIAGSLMWSLLLRGQRLVIIWGPRQANRQALAVIQDAGDLLVIPPGCQYAWYNIRACISHQGHFYVPDMFESYKGENGKVFGTLQILQECQPVDLDTGDCQEIIAYFVLVKVLLWMMEQGQPATWFSRAIKVLNMPVFAYLPRVSGAKLFTAQLEYATRVLSWTSPFATLALYRVIQQRTTDEDVDIEVDSLPLLEVEKPLFFESSAGETFNATQEAGLVPTHVSATAQQVEEQDRPDDRHALSTGGDMDAEESQGGFDGAGQVSQKQLEIDLYGRDKHTHTVLHEPTQEDWELFGQEYAADLSAEISN